MGGGNNHRLKYWTFQVIGWGCFTLINFLLNYADPRVSKYQWTKLLLFVLIGMALTHLMRYFILRYEIMQKSYAVLVSGFVSLSVFSSVLHSVLQISTQLTFDLPVSLNGAKALLNILLIQAIYAFFIYALWNALYFLIHYVEMSIDQKLNRDRLDTTIKNLELKNINSYISPHFIFNALSTIRALITEDPSKARDAVTSLASILRNSLQLKKYDVVSLETELDTVQDYLALQHIRFENRLKVEFHIEPSTLAVPVPILMVQTLVENAVKHGISRQVKGGLIRISSQLKENYLQLMVENTGRLNSNRQQSGFGWSSTAARLGLLFGDEASLQMRTNKDKLAEVIVRIPVAMVTPALG